MQVTQFQLLFIERLRKSKNTIIVLSPCYSLKTLVVNVTFNLATETGTLLNLVGRSFSYLNTCSMNHSKTLAHVISLYEHQNSMHEPCLKLLQNAWFQQEFSLCCICTHFLF